VITTTFVGIGIYAFGYLTPWPLWHPVKIFGNLSGTGLIAGCAVFTYRRISGGQKAGKNCARCLYFLLEAVACGLPLTLAMVRESAPTRS
jgi:hypothetical protein